MAEFQSWLPWRMACEYVKYRVSESPLVRGKESLGIFFSHGGRGHSSNMRNKVPCCKTAMSLSVSVYRLRIRASASLPVCSSAPDGPPSYNLAGKHNPGPNNEISRVLSKQRVRGRSESSMFPLFSVSRGIVCNCICSCCFGCSTVTSAQPVTIFRNRELDKQAFLAARY